MDDCVLGPNTLVLVKLPAHGRGIGTWGERKHPSLWRTTHSTQTNTGGFPFTHTDLPLGVAAGGCSYRTEERLERAKTANSINVPCRYIKQERMPRRRRVGDR